MKSDKWTEAAIRIEAEEGAKEAFGHVVQQKCDFEAESKRLRTLLDSAYNTIRYEPKRHNT